MPDTHETDAQSSNEKLLNELECSLCMKLLYHPVTLFCGHTFCRACLIRSLDHSSKCPLCRQIIHIDPHTAPSNVLLQNLIEKTFPEEYKELVAEEEKENESSHFLPLFVLSINCFPNQQFPMHIFEPRYRLMMRRVLQGSHCFGLVSAHDDHIHDVGCCLEVTQSQTLPDGRSIVNTKGTKRFRILEKSTLDGYLVGKVEYYEDAPIADEEKQSVYAKLVNIKEKSEEFFLKVAGEAGAQSTELADFLDALNLLPRETDSHEQWSKYTFFVSSILPASDETKQKLLEIDSISERLDLLKKMLDKGLSDNSSLDCTPTDV